MVDQTHPIIQRRINWLKNHWERLTDGTYRSRLPDGLWIHFTYESDGIRVIRYRRGYVSLVDYDFDQQEILAFLALSRVTDWPVRAGKRSVMYRVM